MNHQPTPTTPDAGAINQRVKTAVQSHGIKLRVLTTAAFTLGFVAIAASILIVTFYVKIYLPEQGWVSAEAQRPAEWAKVDMKHIDRLVRAEAVQTDILGTGVTIVALAVTVLGLGTLMLMTVVVLNRRVALNQINDSLAQISKQLRELQTERGST
jgi:hypothetical protein